MENENQIVEEITEEKEENTYTCCICKTRFESENPSVLTVSSFSLARYLCPECEADLEEATKSQSVDNIAAAMDRISKKLSENDIDDKATLESLDEIMSDASERAEEIKEGSYDFALDEEAVEEIPEELLETEEDKELDRIDEEKSKKIDKVFDWITFAVLFAIIAAAAYWAISMFF